jgi:hypothetical protein
MNTSLIFVIIFLCRTREAVDQLWSYESDKGSWCTVDLCSPRHCMESCGVESCATPPPKPLSPLAKPLQAQSTSSLAERWTRMEHIKKIHTQSNQWSADAVYFRTSNIILWNTPQISHLLSIDYCYLVRLINHNSEIKAHACIYRISSAVLQTISYAISDVHDVYCNNLIEVKHFLNPCPTQGTRTYLLVDL